MQALLAFLPLCLPPAQVYLPEPPPLEDTLNFGPAGYESCRAVVDVLDTQIALLERQLEIECVPYYQLCLQETLDLLRLRRRAWELLAHALEPCFSPQWRRECLHELRDLLGWDSYYRGSMP